MSERRSRAQRRDLNRKDVQPVKRSLRKVPAVFAAFRSRLVAAMTRTSTRNGLVPAHALELALLQDAQERDLRLRGQLADLVQEDRPAVRELEPTDALLQRARERPALVPEQLRGNQRRLDGPTVDRDERT